MKLAIKLLAVIAAVSAVTNAQKPGPDGEFGLVYRNVLASTPSSLGHGGNVRPAFSSVWPALKGAGVGFVLLQLEPNATHLPHWHKGVELLFVINGNLTVGISSFNTSVGVNEYNLTNGDAIVVENAAAHYVRNRGPGRSINLSAFSNDNPGTQLSAQTLFDFSDQIVQTSLQTDTATVQSLRQNKPATPALFDGLNKAQQTATQSGNFTQSLGAITVTPDQTQVPASVATAG